MKPVDPKGRPDRAVEGVVMKPVDPKGRPDRVASNQAALEKALVALEGLTDEHAAIVEHARTLAREIDRADVLSDSKLHGEYRQVLKVLLEVGRKKDIDAFERMLKELLVED